MASCDLRTKTCLRVSHSEGDVENGRHASFRQLVYGSTEFKTFDLGNYTVWSFTVPRPYYNSSDTANQKWTASLIFQKWTASLIFTKEWTWRSLFSWNITRLARGLWVSGDLIAVHYRNLRYFPAHGRSGTTLQRQQSVILHGYGSWVQNQQPHLWNRSWHRFVSKFWSFLDFWWFLHPRMTRITIHIH